MNGKLCFVRGNKAYFTEVPLEEEWGEGWDESPYTIYAEPPEGEGYEDIESVYFEIPDAKLKLPSGKYTIEEINNKEVPWISYSVGNLTRYVYAGTPYKDFVNSIFGDGGDIYEKTSIMFFEE